MFFPKPERRRTTKARADRRERAVVKAVREHVERRDGRCRLARAARLHPEVFGACDGPGAWAHHGDKKRFKTRGLPPEERHTVEDSLMLCNGRHHPDYDNYRVAITPVDPERRCEGELVARRDGVEVVV